MCRVCGLVCRLCRAAEDAWKLSGKLERKRDGIEASSPYQAAVKNVTALVEKGAVSAEEVCVCVKEGVFVKEGSF